MKDLTRFFDAVSGDNPEGPLPEGVEVFEAPGIIGFSYTPPNFEKFRILVEAAGSYDPAIRNDLLERIESELGFRFPAGIPVPGDSCQGFEFEGRPPSPFELLPKGWTLQAPEEGNSNGIWARIMDSQGRLRGSYSQPDRLYDRSFLNLNSRFRFDNDIIGRTTYQVPLFMPNFTSAEKLAIPCFVYVHAGFWPDNGSQFDFTRVGKELDAIDKAKEFIAVEIHKAFPGTFLPQGVSSEVITFGKESARMGLPIPGDVFAYWNDSEEEITRKLSELRARLEDEVPKILGPDNSLIVSLFPTAEQVEEIKANPPLYTPPQPKNWQKAVFLADGLMQKLKGPRY